MSKSIVREVFLERFDSRFMRNLDVSYLKKGRFVVIGQPAFIVKLVDGMTGERADDRFVFCTDMAELREKVSVGDTKLSRIEFDFANKTEFSMKLEQLEGRRAAVRAKAEKTSALIASAISKHGEKGNFIAN